MSQGTRNVVLVLGLAGLVLALAYLLPRGVRTTPHTALDMAPSDTALLAEIDVPALRRSRLWSAFLDRPDQGVSGLVERCGFDPLERIRTAMVFVTGSSEAALDEVAFVARGDLDRAELVPCIESVVRADGGSLHRTRLEGVEAIASDHGPSVAAFYGDDGVVAGPDVTVASLLRVHQGATGGTTSAPLRSLWTRVESEELHAVAVLPPHWRDLLVQAAASVESMDWLETAEALALGADVSSDIALHAAIALPSASSAEAARAALATLLESALQNPTITQSALSAPLRRATISASGSIVEARIRVEAEELDGVVAALRSATAPAEPASPEAAPLLDATPTAPASSVDDADAGAF